MLGSLFGEEEENGFTGESEADAFPGKRNGNSFSVSPPRPRLECNMAGIENQGATCYLNSLLQTLLFTPEFRESLFQIPKEELGCLEDRDKPGSKVRVIPLQLQRLFVRMLLKDKQSFSTRELTDSFGWSNNEQLQQHDVQELSRILFSAINDSLAGTSGGNLITDLYHGSIVNQIICSECQKCSGREEDFLDLTLTISGNNGLESALSRYYEETELLDGKNQYHCETCQKLVDAKKGARLKKLPPILTVSLLRFSYDFNKMERFKEVGKFTFPLELDMAPYMDKPGDNEMYELFSVVIHQGSAYGGHYHAYIRDIDNLGTWYSPDEEKIHLEPSKENEKLDVQELDTPLELLEAILLEQKDRSISPDKLGSEIVSRTGKSWKKRFASEYGQMKMFIKKHDDVFILNQSNNTIQLKEGYSISTKSSDRPVEDSQPAASTDLPNHSPTTNGMPEPGNCWFDYNDSRVSPISLKSLETQFQGKESAYMLFYRRKDLKRPQEAMKNPSYKIDEDLVLDVLKENDEIHKQRLEYDNEVNRISVKIYFACNYTITNSVIKPESISPEYTVLSIDKRKTVAELFATIHEVGNEMVPREPVINRLKELPSGFLIQEKLSEDVDKVLEDVGIKDQDKLFIWDGQPIVLEGNTDQVFLTVIIGNSQHQGWFPRNMTLNLLIEQVSAISDIPNKENLTVKKLDCDSKSVILDLTESLEKLKLHDGDAVIEEERNRENSSCKENGNNKTETEATNNTIESSSGPEAVSNSMIRLRFPPGDESTTQDDSITIDNNVTVKECLTKMLLQSKRTGDDWHLRKTNWCQEAGEVLNDDTISLQAAGIQDGDHLLIEPGKLPPKGSLVLSIWLHQTLSTSTFTTNYISSCISSLANSFQDLFNNIVGSNENGKIQIFMGEVMISKESTLEDLKFQIMTLPQVLELQIPSIEYLRVRKQSNSRPSTILRDLNHALKRHKLKTPEDLAIQILPQSESLSTSEIILEVKVRQPETSTYSESVEVLWDISKGNGIGSLKQAIADVLMLPKDQILLAKYFHQRFEWSIIKEKDPVPVQKKKGKKKAKVEKVNLRQSPYFISDGDIIGVKNLEKDQNKDFSTQEDIEGKKRLQVLAEEKKKKKEEDIIEKEVPTDKPRTRRPEVALTIKVDKFT